MMTEVTTTTITERNKWLHRYGGRELYDYFDPEGMTTTITERIK